MKDIKLLTVAFISLLLFGSINVNACTGNCLKSKDGGVVYGRTMEWGTFDLHSRVVMIPRGYRITGSTPDGQNGKVYTGKSGVVGLDMIGTNSPNYDWHMTNLSNYVNLSQYSFPAKQISGVEIKRIGAGTCMLGLLGDNTPPSRFILAAAWNQTARDLPTAKEAVDETFRILDNFNLPQGPGSSEGTGEGSSDDLMRSSTIWTTAGNLTGLTLNYHTQHHRRVRTLDFKNIEFSKIGQEIVRINLDDEKEQDIKDITPKL